MVNVIILGYLILDTLSYHIGVHDVIMIIGLCLCNFDGVIWWRSDPHRYGVNYKYSVGYS